MEPKSHIVEETKQRCSSLTSLEERGLARACCLRPGKGKAFPSAPHFNTGSRLAANGSRGLAGSRSLPGTENNHGMARKGSRGMEQEWNKCFWTGIAAQPQHQASLGIAGRGDTRFGHWYQLHWARSHCWKSTAEQREPSRAWKLTPGMHRAGDLSRTGKKFPARDTGQSRP